jgi:adenosyl cobinamide kinase/adenosyl cobinamide phosphate guanylyltransferase
VSNIILELGGEAQTNIEDVVQAEIESIVAAQTRLSLPLITVSNGVGLGLIPPIRSDASIVTN